MSAITIRNIDESVKQSLRELAASNGQSMEEEVRIILKRALDKSSKFSERMGTRIVNRFTNVDTNDFVIPKRTEQQRPVEF